jgi:hypothetical protein
MARSKHALLVLLLTLVAALAAAQELHPGYEFSYSSEWSGRVVLYNRLEPELAAPYNEVTAATTARLSEGTMLTPLRLHYLVPGLSAIHGGALRGDGADRTIGRYLMLVLREREGWRHVATYLHWGGEDSIDESTVTGDLVRFDRLDPSIGVFLQAAIDECAVRLNNGTSFIPMRAHVPTAGVAVVLGSAVKDAANEQKSGRYMMVLVEKEDGWHYTDFFIHWAATRAR